jgi:HEAT repeat protein
MPDLLRTLSAGSVSERRGSVIGLALLPVPGLAVDGLLTALADEDATVRRLAAHALGKIGAPAAPDVAEKLADADNRVRVAAALSLSKMGSSAVPSLIQLLQREDPMIRAKAAWLLGAMGQDALAAVPALIRALETEDIRLVHVIAEAIDTIGPDPVLVYIELTLLGRERIDCPVTRIGAAAAPTLVKLLARPGTPLGNVALYALARMGPVAEPALRATLASGTDGQRAAAALLLTGIDPKLVHTLPEDLRRTLAGAMNTN